MKRTKVDIAMTALLTTMMLLAAGFMFSACSTDDTPASSPTTPDSEIRLNADVWRMMEGTRATTYDNAAALQGETGGFKCYAYVAESTTPYVNGSVVKWESDKWVFQDGKHYWPNSSSLDFFAHIPATIPAYITAGPTYSFVAGEPGHQQMTFTCTLPTTGATQSSDLKEFIYAFAASQNKTSNEGNGVGLTFQHPFVRVMFTAGTIDAEVTVTGITLNAIKYNETFTYGNSPQWTSAGLTTNFTGGVFDVPYLVVPQNWGGTIDVNILRSGTPEVLYASVPTEWEAGNSYTYTFNISASEGITVDVNKFTEQW